MSSAPVKTFRRVRGRQLFALARPVLTWLGAIVAVLPPWVAQAGLGLCRDVPGYPGLALRYLFVKRLAAACGDNVAVYPGAYLFDVGGLHIGSNVKIGEMCFLGAAGGIHIADDVSLAHGTSVLTEEHDHSAAGPLRDTPLRFRPVRIGRGVWVGAGVRLLAGVTIGAGTAVGAGSVVTRDLPPDSIVAGVPARVIKPRETTR